MKDKRFEEIIGAAFGELDGELVHMTEAERQELEQYLAMRRGLKSLRDVPEHQLSNERLRNAILGSAVRPRRAFGGWGYAGAALVATALFLVFVQSRAPLEGPQRTARGTEGSRVERAGPADSSVPTIVQGQSKDTVVASNAQGDRRPLESSLDASAFEPRDLKEFVPVSFSPREPAVRESLATKSAAERDALVVVDANSKTRNGAAKATEVTNYGDVVFGG